MRRFVPHVNHWAVVHDWTGRRWYEVQWGDWVFAAGLLKGNHRFALLRDSIRQVKQENVQGGDTGV